MLLRLIVFDVNAVSARVDDARSEASRARVSRLLIGDRDDFGAGADEHRRGLGGLAQPDGR